MFKKLLIANRGEIAVRIVRACRDLGIQAVSVYDAGDRGSLHVRLSDEAYQLDTLAGYRDGEAMLRLAAETGAEAIHAGYSFLAEQVEFVKACEQRGVVFVGPDSSCLAMVLDRIATLERVRAAGLPAVDASSRAFLPEESEALAEEATRLGYPVVVKSCAGSGVRGAQLVHEAAELPVMIDKVAASGQAAYGDRRVYLEAAILPSQYVEVAIMGDNHGNLIHMGERDGSIQRNNQKLITESPSPALSQAQREALWQNALAIARLTGCRNACTVEFVIDEAGRAFFVEVKARIQVEHPVSEMVTRIDLIREQLRVAAGLPLSYSQEQVRLNGVAMFCRVNAEDPYNHFLPSPGRLSNFRLPGGPNVRVDTFAYAGYNVPVLYDPLLAKLVVWGSNREECLNRLRRALDDFSIRGVRTNLPLLERIADDPDFAAGTYTTEFGRRRLLAPLPPDGELADLAAVAALAYLSRRHAGQTATPEQFGSGWHRDSRRIPG